MIDDIIKEWEDLGYDVVVTMGVAYDTLAWFLWMYKDNERNFKAYNFKTLEIVK